MVCSKCGIEKQKECFEPQRRQCRDCRNEYKRQKESKRRSTEEGLAAHRISMKKSYQKHRDKRLNEKHQRIKNKEFRIQRKDYDLNRSFGLSLKQYQEMLDAQDGVCFVCHRPERIKDNKSGFVRALAVDHNHITGEIRKLLCNACNTALGYLEENADRCRQLALYIEGYQSKLAGTNVTQAT